MVLGTRYRSPCFGLADFGVKRAFCYSVLSLQLKRLRVVRVRLLENPAQKFMRVSLFPACNRGTLDCSNQRTIAASAFCCTWPVSA